MSVSAPTGAAGPGRIGAERALVAAGAVAIVVATVAAVAVVGPVGLLAPAAVAALVVLVARPPIALGLLAATTLLFEDANTPTTVAGRFFTPFHGPSPAELLVFALAVGVALDVRRRRSDALLPGGVGVALIVMACAIAAAAVVGYDGGADRSPLGESVRQLALLVIVPVLVVNVVRDQVALRHAVVLGGGAAVIKAALGLASLPSGGDLNDGTLALTYYEPTANVLILAAILGVIAAGVRGVRIPWGWWVATALLLVPSLALSYRRSFWIATVAGVVLVAVAGSGRARRRLMIPALCVVLGLGYLGVTTFGAGSTDQALVERARSLDPRALQTNVEDRYRLDERRNVTAEVRAAPITGLGLDVPWRARYPLSVEHDGGRQYVHFVALWWWLRLGVAGLLAYVLLMAATTAAAWRVSRSHPDPLVRTAGLAAFALVPAVALAETTASFTGADTRMTVVVAVLVGLVAAARRQSRSPVALDHPLVERR